MKKLALLLLALVMAFSVAMPASAAGFPDVPETHFAYDEINYLVSLGAISGMPNGTFAPRNHVTRAEAAKIIAELLELEADEDFRIITDDFKPSHWAYQSMKKLVFNNIMFGYLDGMRPNAPLTRAQVAAIINRAFDLAPPTQHWQFADVSQDHWAYYDINQIFANGITTETGMYRPSANVTRAEFAVFVARALDDQFKK